MVEGLSRIDGRLDPRRMASFAARTLAVVALSVMHTGSGEMPDGAAASGVDDRCDLDFNTDEFNQANDSVHQHHGEGTHIHSDMGAVNFTVEEWAEVFASDNMSPEEVVQELNDNDNDLYRRQILGGVLTHTLDPDPWEPMTDPDECKKLADELQTAQEVAARYPTVADALAAGYSQGDTYYAGLGAHFQNWELADAFRANQPSQLLYAGTDKNATLVGLSYVVVSGNEPPEGFTGTNDRWHEHRSFCLDEEAINMAADVLSREECRRLGGVSLSGEGAWMLHVWRGNDWGVFAAANPSVKYVSPG